MSIFGSVRCNSCHVLAVAEWNGENYIAPSNWAEVCEPKFGATMDIHLCPNCIKDLKEPITMGELKPVDLSADGPL